MRPENVLMGKRIAAARQRRQWSKADLARKAGVAASYVTRIEQGSFDRPSVDRIKALADALGVHVLELTEPEPVLTGSAIDLATLFRPDEAEVVAEILRIWARHDEKTRQYLLSTMKPLILGIPDGDS